MDEKIREEREKRNVAIENSLNMLNAAILGLDNVINQIKEGNVPSVNKSDEKLQIRSMAELVDQLPSDIDKFIEMINKQSAQLTEMFL